MFEHNDKDNICPSCQGFGQVYSNNKIINCGLCNGTGALADKNELWRKQGKSLKYHRLYVVQIGLRKSAKLLGVDASNLSKMERGIIKPYNVWKGSEHDNVKLKMG